MPISNYVRPQTQIAEDLVAAAAATTAPLSALVVGPSFNVVPFTTAPTGTGVAYLTAGVTVPFPGYSAGQVLDNGKYPVRVYGSGLTLSVASGAGTIPNIAASNIVQLGSGTAASNDIELGDTFATVPTTGPNAGYTRTVVGFVGANIASSYGVGTEAASNPAANASTTVTQVSSTAVFTVATNSGTFAGLVKGATYGGFYGDLITLTCVVPGAPGTATLNISSASGLYNATNVPTTNAGGKYQISGTFFDGLAMQITEVTSTPLATGNTIVFQIKGAYALVTTSDLTIADLGSGYTGTANTTYLIKVTTGGASGAAIVSVSDTAGIDAVQTYTVTSATPFNLGTFGLVATFNSLNADAQGGLRNGDIYAVAAVAATNSTTSFDKIVLSGPAIDITGDANGVAVNWTDTITFSGEIIPTATNQSSQTWTVPGTLAGGVVFAASAVIQVTRTAGVVYKAIVNNTGQLFPSYRAFSPPVLGEDVLVFNSDSDVISQLGAILPENTLAYGVSRALVGSQGATVYGLRTASFAVGDFSTALQKVSNNDSVYALAILSTDLSVKELAASHVNAMSQPTVKNFRRAYVATDSPGTYPVLQFQPNSTNWTATVSLYNAQNIKLDAVGNPMFTTLGLVAGDLVRISFSTGAFGVVTYASYPIATVISDTELILASGPLSAISPAIKFEIWKAVTPQSQALYVQNVSSTLGTRRVCNVWTDNGTAVAPGAAAPQVIPNMFLAAEIAGLRSALFPQQGLTWTNITSITAAPNMYLFYPQSVLDQIASYGVFIVTQDVNGGPVYIRHQLTTDSSDQSGLYWEDSIGTNLDNIAFGINAIVSNYIGKRNANPTTLSQISQQVNLYLQTNTLVSPNSNNDIGPAIISFTNPIVVIDPVFADRINVTTTLTLPAPINNIVVTLTATVTA